MFSNPDDNVLEFGFLSGQKIVDLGAGAGHYSSALSRVVGASGMVIAVDINKEALTRIKNQSTRDGVGNIEVVWGDIEKPGGTKLRDNFADGAVFSNILFQLEDRLLAIQESRRIVRPNGIVAVVEWSDLSFLSNTKSEAGKQPVSEEETRRLFESSGFRFERAFEAGEYHYGILFRKDAVSDRK